MRGHLAQGPSLACHFGDLLSLSMCWPSPPTTFLAIPLTSHHFPHLPNALPWMDDPSATWVGTSFSSHLV